MSPRHMAVVGGICALVAALVAAPARALDPVEHIDRAVKLIEAGQHGLARSYLGPALISPQISSGQRSRAYYLRGFSFFAERLFVSARKDYNRALEFNGQNPAALYSLGTLHFFGQGTPRDVDLSFSLFSRAAELDHVAAKYQVGVGYLRGLGTTQDLEQGRTWLSEAAEAGHGLAMMQLAASYRVPLVEEPDTDLAKEWYEKAYEAGAVDALVSIGYMHQKGEFGEADQSLAYELFSRAADEGSLAAKASLAHQYLTGSGVTPNYERAAALFTETAEQGIASSYVGLGHMFEAGLGVVRSLEQARDYYTRGAKAGHLLSQMRLVYLLLSTDGGRQDRVEAVRWLERAIKHDNATAYNDYAWVLATSRYDDLRDGELAIEHAKRAVERERSAAHLDTLAAAYAEVGRWEEAVTTQKEALALLEDDEEADILRQFQEHLAAYENEEAWRE